MKLLNHYRLNTRWALSETLSDGTHALTIVEFTRRVSCFEPGAWPEKFTRLALWEYDADTVPAWREMARALGASLVPGWAEL